MKIVWRICLKDLRIEARSRVILQQVIPFAVVTLVLFGLAFNANRASLRDFTPGLFWVTVLLASLLFVLRSFGLETEDGAADNLRLSGIHPAQIFFGKAIATCIGLLVLEIVLGVGVFIFYDTKIASYGLLVSAGFLGAAGVASVGTIYGVLSASLRARETILPLLMLPALVPIFLGAIRAFDDALGSNTINGWLWLSLLGSLAFAYSLFGAFIFGPLLEEVES